MTELTGQPQGGRKDGCKMPDTERQKSKKELRRIKSAVVIEAPIKCNGYACTNHSPELQRQLYMERQFTHLLTERETADRAKRETANF